MPLKHIDERKALLTFLGEVSCERLVRVDRHRKRDKNERTICKQVVRYGSVLGSISSTQLCALTWDSITVEQYQCTDSLFVRESPPVRRAKTVEPTHQEILGDDFGNKVDYTER